MDLHNHVLFGVDDGARSVAQSVAMLDGMAQLGYAEIAVSPHFDAASGEPGIGKQIVLIDAIEIARDGASLPRIHPGAEIMFDERFLDPAHAALWPPIGGKGSAYLVELGMQPGAVPARLEEQVFRLTARGLTLVLAHPERIADLQRDFFRLEKIRRAGMLLQLDIMALVGRYGSKAQAMAVKVLGEGGYDLIASDIHKPEDLPLLRRALLCLCDDFGDSFEKLASMAPRLLLEGRSDELD